MISQLIQERRTVRDFLSTPLSAKKVIELLNVAVWAPTHGKREPWRFLLFEEEGRRKLIHAIVSTFSEEDRAKYRQSYENYLLAVPVQLIVIVPKNEKNLIWEEDLCAAAAMIQNLQLAAWDEQIGMVWKTSELFNESIMKKAFQISEDEQVIGLLLLGYFDKIPKEQTRTNAYDKTIIIHS